MSKNVFTPQMDAGLQPVPICNMFDMKLLFDQTISSKNLTTTEIAERITDGFK